MDHCLLITHYGTSLRLSSFPSPLQRSQKGMMDNSSLFGRLQIILQSSHRRICCSQRHSETARNKVYARDKVQRDRAINQAEQGTSFYHSIPLSLTLTVAEGCKASTKQNLFASFSRTPFNWWGWIFIWFWHNSSWTCWYYFWRRCNKTREMNVVLLMLACIFTLMNQFDSNLVRSQMLLNSTF